MDASEIGFNSNTNTQVLLSNTIKNNAGGVGVGATSESGGSTS